MTRRLVVWTLMTLDGYFEGNDKWDLAFHERVWGDDLERFSLDQAKQIGTLLFGRVTYEGMERHWRSANGAIADFMNETEKIVVSRKLADVQWTNSRILSGDIDREVKALKGRVGKDIYVFGSAELADSLLQYGLVDEYRVCLVPVLLGSGNPLFKTRGRPIGMALNDCRRLGTDAVYLSYLPRTTRTEAA